MDIIQGFIENITDYIAEIPQIVPILVTLIIGIVLVAWGYSLFRIWLTLLGIGVGYYLGTKLAEFLELDSWPYALVVILITLAMSLFFWLAVKLSIFVAGFFFGMYLVRYLSITLFGLDERIVTIAVGIILGILGVVFLRIFIISATAITGAYLVSDAVNSLIQNTDAGSWIAEITPARDPIPIIMVFVLVGVATLGILYQYRRSARGKGIRLHGKPL